jgi:hypothetical protein
VTHDYRDDVVEQLAAYLAEAEASRVTYRRLAQLAIHHAHDLHVELTRLRAQQAALRDELRRYTATSVSSKRAA